MVWRESYCFAVPTLFSPEASDYIGYFDDTPEEYTGGVFWEESLLCNLHNNDSLFSAKLSVVSANVTKYFGRKKNQNFAFEQHYHAERVSRSPEPIRCTQGKLREGEASLRKS